MCHSRNINIQIEIYIFFVSGELTDIRDKYVVGDLPSNWHVDAENNQDIVITVKDKLTEERVTKDVTRTIHVTNPDGQTHDETQTVTFNGKKVTNEATGEVTYIDWTTDDDTLDSYQVPNVPGYTATHTEIAEMQATPETSNQVVNITYSANAQQNSIEFYDDDSKQVIFTKDITGKTGEKVAYDVTSDFASYQDKYETSDALNGTWDVQPENNEVIRVHVTHKTKSETESKDVHRTIHVHKPDGSVETIAQTVTFTRTKTTDLVTNESTYTDWSSENPNYEAYDVPALTGYKASQDKVEASKSTGTDEVVDVTYEPIEQSIHVKIINERGETLKDFEVTGKTDENAKINYPDLSALVPKYDLGELPATWTVQKENNQDIVITAKDKLIEEPVTKEITRTINLHQPDGDKQEVQKVTFTGTKVTNEATGEVTYKDWSTDDDTFKEYQVPEVEGYTASKEVILSEKVDKDAVDKDAVDEVIDVDYVGNMQDITIEIVDENNKVLAMKDAHAKTGENIQYDMTKMFESFKEDYMAKDALSGTYKVQAKDNIVIIHAAKRHNSDSETKTITRIIHVTNPDGTQQDVTQTVTFTRSKTTDLTNNQVTYGEWKADNDHFEAYDVPKVNGYTSNIGTVELMPVTPETISSEVSVSYTENVTETTEEKDFMRYIIVQKPDGSKETITQKVHGSRTKTVHEASGDTSYSDWTLTQGSFDVYTPASIEGYSVREVESVDVDTSSEMPLVEYVVYQAEMKDEGTQTETPNTTDSETQTKAEVKVIYKFADGRVYKEFSVNADKGAVIDGSDLEMLPDDMDFTDEFTTYEVKGDGADVIERTVKKQTSDSETQTKATIHVVYKNADGTVYKEFDVQADKGSVLDGSDLEMLPDNMNFTDDFTTYEVKGDGTDHIERSVKKQTSDSETQTKTTIHVVYKNADGTIYKEFDVQADKGTVLDGSDLEMLPDDMNFIDDFTTYEVKGDGTDHIERSVKKQTSDSGTQTKATIHVVYRNADGTIYKEFDVQADKGSILDGSDLEMLPDDMNFTDEFTTYEVKGDGTDAIERTVKKQTSDSETQTKTTIHVVYKNADGTIYKEFDIQADKGSILDGSDLEVLPDDMNFTDGFTTYEVKGDGTDTIERTVKKNTSDNGTQTDNPTTSDGGTQTDNPDTSDSETQTKAAIHVVYRNADGTIYKEFDVQADKGTVLDGSDLEMLPDDMDFTDDFTTYEVKGDGTDNIERTVKKQTSDSETQTKTTIHVVYRNADGTVYKEFDVQADKGSILDGSDLEMLPDDMNFTDEFTTYEVKGDGTDNIERTVKKQTSDNGSQTDNPTTSDGGTQTDNPDTSDSETQTKTTIHVVYRNADGTVYKEFDVQADKGSILDASDLEMLPDDMNFTDEFTTYEVKGDGTDAIERSVKKQTSDSGSQTDNPDTSDGATQTKAEIKVVYKNADGTVYKEFDVQADKGTILDASDLEMLSDDMEFNDDFMFYEVKGDGTDNIERIVKKVTPDQGSQTDNPDTSDGSTQTDTPDSKDNGTQTDNPDTSDGGTQTDTPDSKDNGTQTDNPDTSDGGTQTDTPDSKDNGTQTDNPDASDKGNQTDEPDIKDDATQTDRSKDEPTQSIPKQDGISEVKPLSNKVTSGYTRVQPTKSVGHLSNAGQLPKAGSTDNSKLGLIGAVFALLGGMIGFVSRRKVHK